jgi:ComF family protein
MAGQPPATARPSAPDASADPGPTARSRTGSSRPIEGLARLGGSLLDLALPASCAGCGVEGAALCPTCARQLGVRLAAPPGVPLGLPAALPLPLAQAEWCAPFSGPLRAALHRLKYAGERRAVPILAEAMAARWRVAGAGGDLLVPVPADAARARRRGYDQAFLLAAAVSERLELAWRPALERTRRTAPQFELGRRARLSNVTGAFAVRPEAAGAVRGRWPILVDDVATTGATLVSCAEALYEAGAVAVSALTAARER